MKWSSTIASRTTGLQVAKEVACFASESTDADDIGLPTRLVGLFVPLSLFIGVTPMNHTIVASFSFTLLVAIALLVREVRFRRSLQKLLHRLLSLWRLNFDEEHEVRGRDRPDDRGRM